MSLGLLTDDLGLIPGFLLSEQEVAEIVGCSRKSVYRMRRRGELGYVRGEGGIVRIPRESVERWIAAHYVAPVSQSADQRVPRRGVSQRRAGSENVVSLQELERRHRNEVCAP